MNVCFQNHIEEKQYSETTLLATHNDRNRRNTSKQTNNILRLSAGHWMFLVYLYNVLLKPRLKQDSCKTFRISIICLLCLLQGSQDIRKTSLKSKKHFSAAISICTFLKGMLVVYEFALSETHHFLTGIL